MKILVIRRDNIGDLVCTIPLLRCIAARPGTVVDVLANEYNWQVLEGSPEIRRVWVYRKAKHRKQGESALAIWWASLKLLLNIRREKYDYVFIGSPGFQSSAARFARHAGARCIVGYDHPGNHVDLGLPAEQAGQGHEVEAAVRLASLLNLPIDEIPSPRILPQAELRAGYGRSLGDWPGSTVAIHISARKKSQRWPAERFSALIREICQGHGGRVLLFWSPGAENDPLHPGDDAKAASILEACGDLPVTPMATSSLRELIAAVSLADSYIGADGGAMHIAAGVGLPVVALFGDSDVGRWHPWVKPALWLQKASREVGDLSVAEVLDAWRSVSARTDLSA